MTATLRTVPDIRSTHEVFMPKLNLFSPVVCNDCSVNCLGGALLRQPPKSCQFQIIHALSCDYEMGYFESPRRSGKTHRLISIAEEFEKVGASTLFVVPVMSYASQLRKRFNLGNQREIRSFRSLRESSLSGKKHYVFVDEVLPSEMEEVWGLLAFSGCVFVTGYFTNRD